MLLNAQNTSHTIVNENCIWNIVSLQVEDETGIVNIPRHTTKMFFQGDSIVNSISYKKVFYCFDDELCQTVCFEGLIREENQKTYFVFPNETREFLLYDFSSELGDIIKFDIHGISIEEPEEFRTFSYQVHNIDYIYINDNLKKKVELTQPQSDIVVDIWVENFGSILNNFITIDNPPGFSKVLSCYFQNNELIYQNPEYPDCFYATNIPEIEYINNVRFKINSQVLFLEFDYSFSGTISIYSLTGNLLYKNELINQLFYNVEIASLNQGIYLLHIDNNIGEHLVLKFLNF